MVPIWACVTAFIIGVALALGLGYFLAHGRLAERYSSGLLQAGVEAAREKALREAQEHLFDDIHPEVQYFVTNEKQFFVKRIRVVIRERLLYKHVPLMGWMEHSHVVNEQMDAGELEQFAMAAARLIEASDGGSAAIRRIPA